MRRKTAQKFLGASGGLVLLGGGSCFVAFNAPFSTPFGNGFALFLLSGTGELIIAAILFLVGVIGLLTSRRDG